MKIFTLVEICKLLNGELQGNQMLSVTGPEQLEYATSDQITFIGHRRYLPLWEKSKACAAIINNNIKAEPGEGRAFVRVANADLAMALLLESFLPESPVFDQEVHPTAVVHPTATLGTGTRIGAGCYVGPGTILGDRVTLYPNVTIMDQCKVGSDTTIWSGTVIRERCVVGSHCLFHLNVSIGGDGFGFRPSADGRGLVKIPHIGNVVIGNGVELGSGVCIDRGKFSSTVLGDGTKIDNLVQIGHNSRTGRFCMMAGNSGLAGSVTLGDGVIVGGSASISDHVTLGNGVMVGGGSGVMNDVPDGGKVLGYPAADSRETLKQWVALRKLAKEG